MKDVSKKKIIGAFMGTIVEYYDYSLYGFSASIIAAKFFPASDHLTSLTNVFAVYAIAYLSKPLGSIIFGRIGDIYGRKTALSITILGIAIPTMIIGLLPEYFSIGIISTLILIACRFLQSIFIAGEYDGAAIYVIEHLGDKYRATASAITRATGVLGLLVGIASTNFFNAHIFPEWGWRIPFLLSFPLSLVAIYYRNNMEETPVFKEIKDSEVKQVKLISLINSQWRNILAVIFFAGGFGVTYQISIIFMKQYLPIILPASTLVISSFSVLLVLCFGLTMPFSGFLADRYGLMRVINYSLSGTILSCIILIIAVKYEMLNLSLAACLLLASSVAPFNALAHSAIIRVFPIHQRYSGVSLGHTIGSMLMSGSANYVCLKFMKILEFDLFPIFYLMVFAIISNLMIQIFEKQSVTDS
jgi:MHS family proline/betaine transporter-like MFS transporter